MKKGRKNKLSDKIWIVLGVCLLIYCISVLSKRVLTDFLVDENAFHTKAIIIDERNYYPNQPVKHEFSYSYEFEVNGTKYTGDSHDLSLKVGDTVEIKYNKTFPCFNKPLHPKE
ncbi:MAG: hypothetical protein Q8880_12860 [Bacteroidota bacterium]|nr:hypothetical protein [Bacteroidota bacterium]